jgi:hypothetical protein
VRDPLHQATVADNAIGAMADDGVLWPVELLRQESFGDRHADRIGKTLAERTGRGLDPGRHVALGVPGSLGMQLPEPPDLVDGEIVAGEVEHRIEQHRGMAVRQHEAVAVGPVGVRRIVLEVAPPQRLSDVGKPHRSARMADLRPLDGIDR